MLLDVPHRRELAGIAFAAALAAAWAQSPPPSPPSSLPSPRDAARDERWRDDLRTLATELPKRHMNAFHTCPRERFESAVAEADAAIPKLRDDEVIVRFMQIVALIGDAHTSVQWWAQPDRFPQLPLRFQWLKDGYYLVSAAPAYSDALGARLRAVEGRDVAEAAARVLTATARENEIAPRVYFPRMVVMPAVLRGLNLAARDDRATFTLEDRAGKSRTVEVVLFENGAKLEMSTAWGRSSVPLYRSDPDRPYWFRYLDDERLLYIQYNQCRDDPAKPFAKLAEEVLEIARTKPVDRIVIDVRRNSGGNSEVIRPLERGLIDLPVAKAGKLFVVIGVPTASSAMDNALQLKERAHAVLIGEPTSGKPNSFGEIKTFTLPSCGLLVGYSTKFFRSLKDDPPTLAPDVVVEATIDDVIGGRDPVLDAIRAR